MTHVLTGLSFLLLAIQAAGQPIAQWVLVVVFGITALLWIVTAAGVAVPTLTARR